MDNLQIEDLEGEEWRDVAGYEGIYKISNMGRVKSAARLISNGSWDRMQTERILKHTVDDGCYPRVCLCNGISKRSVRVHQVVAIAFLNHTPDGHKLEVDHINGIKTDPRAVNLRIVTNRFNCTLGARKNKDRLTSQYPGVSWQRCDNRWKSEIKLDGKPKYLGLFRNELDAAEAYQSALSKYIASKV